MKIFEASRSLAKLSAQFTAAGLDINQFINAEDETALQAHLASLGEAKVETVVDETALKAAQAKIESFSAALEAAGIKPAASDEKAGLQAADITAAINDRVQLKAAEELAKLGTAPVDAKPKSEAAGQKKTVDPKLTGLARAIAANQLSQAAK